MASSAAQAIIRRISTAGLAMSGISETASTTASAARLTTTDSPGRGKRGAQTLGQAGSRSQGTSTTSAAVSSRVTTLAIASGVEAGPGGSARLASARMASAANGAIRVSRPSRRSAGPELPVSASAESAAPLSGPAAGGAPASGSGYADATASGSAGPGSGARLPIWSSTVHLLLVAAMTLLPSLP